MFKEIFFQAIEPSFVADKKTGKVIAVNDALLEFIEIPDEKRFIDKKIDSIGFTRAFGNMLMTFDDFNEDGYFEDVYLVQPKKNRKVEVDLRVRIVSDVIVVTLRDISERKKLERDLIEKHKALTDSYAQLSKAHKDAESMREQLVQSGKLAALGVLSAGVAHELNQPLTGIKGFSQEILFDIGRGKPDFDTLAGYCREIVKNVDRMKGIIQHLREFVRKQPEAVAFTDVNTVINDSMILLREQFRSHGISIEENLDPNIPKIMCNANELEQAFINFLTNARDALDEAYQIDKTKNKSVKITSRMSDDNHLEIIFEDNGIGMDEAVRKKIFDPFFTTKEVGKGMGLGLSITYSIIDRIGGTIEVVSTPMGGSTFTVRFHVGRQSPNPSILPQRP